MLKACRGARHFDKRVGAVLMGLIGGKIEE
jgi:hypothetical protein